MIAYLAALVLGITLVGIAIQMVGMADENFRVGRAFKGILEFGTAILVGVMGAQLCALAFTALFFL